MTADFFFHITHQISPLGVPCKLIRQHASTALVEMKNGQRQTIALDTLQTIKQEHHHDHANNQHTHA